MAPVSESLPSNPKWPRSALHDPLPGDTEATYGAQQTQVTGVCSRLYARSGERDARRINTKFVDNDNNK